MICRPDLRLRVFAGEFPAIGPGKAMLLERIAMSGSISAAARELGMSYRRAWMLVDAMNQSFAQPLVVTEVGGKAGGGAVVTQLGRDMAKRFRVMERKALRAIAADVKAMARHLKSEGKAKARSPRR